MRRRIGKRAGHREAVLQGRRDVLADRHRATQRRAYLALLLRRIDPRLDRGLVPAERELKSGRGHRRPSHAVRLIGNRAGGQRAWLEVRRRKRGLAIVDAGLAAPIGGGRHARKRIHGLVLALIRQRRRKVERLVAGETERGVGRCGHLPARDAREQEERRWYGAQAQHSTAMHDVLFQPFRFCCSNRVSCSNRFAPTQSEPLGVLWTRAPTRLPRCHRVAAQRRSAHTPQDSLRDSMLGSCCACAKEAPAHSAVTRTARRGLPVELGMDRYNHRNATKNERSTGSRPGTARPFPLWRLRSSPHSPPIDPITREWYCPQARIAGPLTFQRLGWFRPSCDFDQHCPGVWRVCHTSRHKPLIYFERSEEHTSELQS